MALSASMVDGGGGEGASSVGVGSGTAGVMDEADDDLARAIALSLSQEKGEHSASKGDATLLTAGDDVYQPQPVPEEVAAGPEAVRVQVCVTVRNRIRCDGEIEAVIIHIF